MSQTNWEADKMLDVYIYDYLIKRDLKATTQTFQPEAKVSSDPVAIDAPAGFLSSCLNGGRFSGIYSSLGQIRSTLRLLHIARTNKKHSEVAASYIESLNGHSSPIESVAFDSAEVLAAAGASSGVIKLWDLEETKGQHIKAIITADEFLLRYPLEDNVAPDVEELKRRIKPNHNARSEDHGDSKEVTTQHDMETGEEDDLLKWKRRTCCPGCG